MSINMHRQSDPSAGGSCPWQRKEKSNWHALEWWQASPRTGCFSFAVTGPRACLRCLWQPLIPSTKISKTLFPGKFTKITKPTSCFLCTWARAHLVPAVVWSDMLIVSPICTTWDIICRRFGRRCRYLWDSSGWKRSLPNLCGGSPNPEAHLTFSLDSSARQIAIGRYGLLA